MTTPDAAAAILLVFAAPLAFWVAWSDMARMRIPNESVVALALVFFVVGVFVLPLGEWGWRWTHLAVVLVIGFVANMAGLVGAGDAKFAAAMAPYFAYEDAAQVLVLFSAVLLAAFVTHRLARAIPVLRGAAPGWESWRRADFPMGLALAGTLILYLALAAAG